jgi:hypothetical protein
VIAGNQAERLFLCTIKNKNPLAATRTTRARHSGRSGWWWPKKELLAPNSSFESPPNGLSLLCLLSILQATQISSVRVTRAEGGRGEFASCRQSCRVPSARNPNLNRSKIAPVGRRRLSEHTRICIRTGEGDKFVFVVVLFRSTLLIKQLSHLVAMERPKDLSSPSASWLGRPDRSAADSRQSSANL